MIVMPRTAAASTKPDAGPGGRLPFGPSSAIFANSLVMWRRRTDDRDIWRRSRMIVAYAAADSGSVCSGSKTTAVTISAHRRREALPNVALTILVRRVFASADDGNDYAVP